MSYHHGKFVWFEHRSNEVGKAQAFYAGLFGWSVQHIPVGEGGYDMILNGEQGIGGFTQATGGAPTHWVSYLSVEDVDATFKTIAALGCRTMMPPTDMGPMGRAAAVTDPTGAAFALWKGAEGDRDYADTTPVGDWYWNELWTDDDKKALDFYTRILGFDTEAMDMGPIGTYHLLKTGGVPVAGLMKSTEPKARNMWLPYVSVADCDASVAKARSLDARLLKEPTDIPGVGRFAILQDTVGAVFAVIKGQPGM